MLLSLPANVDGASGSGVIWLFSPLCPFNLILVDDDDDDNAAACATGGTSSLGLTLAVVVVEVVEVVVSATAAAALVVTNETSTRLLFSVVVMIKFSICGRLLADDDDAILLPFVSEYMYMYLSVCLFFSSFNRT